jgi:hypothetical protein
LLSHTIQPTCSGGTRRHETDSDAKSGVSLESDEIATPDSLATAMTLTARELLIGDRGILARETVAILAEMGLTYREQEHHTAVRASIVFDMANGKNCDLGGARRFAAFAAHRTRRSESREYWQKLLSRLNRDERRRLTHAGGQANVGTPAIARPSADTIAPSEISALYSALIMPQNRMAVAQLIRALRAAESANLSVQHFTDVKKSNHTEISRSPS